MTDRLLRAIDNPHVDILGHPTGRRILQREPYPLDIEAVIDAAVAASAWRSRSTARPIDWISTTSTRGWRAIAAPAW